MDSTLLFGIFEMCHEKDNMDLKMKSFQITPREQTIGLAGEYVMVNNHTVSLKHHTREENVNH